MGLCFRENPTGNGVSRGFSTILRWSCSDRSKYIGVSVIQFSLAKHSPLQIHPPVSPGSVLSLQRWACNHLMLMLSLSFNCLRICRIRTDVKESRPGAGTRDPDPHAARISIFPSLVPRVLRAAWQQSRMTKTSPCAAYRAYCNSNQFRVAPPSSFLDRQSQFPMLAVAIIVSRLPQTISRWTGNLGLICMTCIIHNGQAFPLERRAFDKSSKLILQLCRWALARD